jgi:hypothetical protein
MELVLKQPIGLRLVVRRLIKQLVVEQPKLVIILQLIRLIRLKLVIEQLIKLKVIGHS